VPSNSESHKAGLRTVATFEASKGLLVLLVSFGLFSLMHKNVEDFAERLVRHLHLNPARHLSHVFLQAAEHVTDARLWALALVALAYSTVRFVEAYGLWNAREWAEWFALLSGAIYLPWEIYQLLEKSTVVRWSVFLINAGIVSYMLYLRLTAAKVTAARDV
jgi:uncharacterized membrane protein (DUF2068 family)